MADVKDWGIAASDNNTTSPDGAQSGWIGADVGPWARETMAAVARSNADPAWVNFMQYGLSPTGTKAIARSGATQIQITATGTWASSTTDIFNDGRLIRFKRSTGEWVYGFITGSSIGSTVLTVDLALMGDSSIDGGWTFTDNELEFFVAMDTIDTDRTEQPLSAMVFGGAGTLAERNARFPSVADIPEGVLWANTTDNLLQIVIGSAGARTWRSIAPLSSIWADEGADLLLESASEPRITLNSLDSSSQALVFQNNGSQIARFIREASGRFVMESGNLTSGFTSRIIANLSDGKPYHQRWEGSSPGALKSMMPGEVYPWPATILRARTGAGSAVTAPQAGTWFEVCAGTLPEDVQNLLESSDWDEMRVDLLAVLTSYFISTPSSNVTYTFNLFLGSGYDTTPPVDLSTGYTKQYSFLMLGEDPFEGYVQPTDSTAYTIDSGSGMARAGTASFEAGFPGMLLNADISGTIDSFYISGRLTGAGNDQDFEWTGVNGNRHASITFRDVVRVVT